MLSPRGFTLVELLVVVALIGLLLGIIVPALGRAREQAAYIACRSNLKQIGIANTAYAHDYDGAIPYGPDPTGQVAPADFYLFEGMVTSVVAMTSGRTVGLGLAVESYLSENPEAIFCPGSDQTLIAAEELARFGRDQVQSSYWYRHGSAPFPGDTPTPLKLTNHDTNRDGQPLTAIAMDTNFLAHPQLGPTFGVYSRTHHDQQRVNVLNLDSSVVGHENTAGVFTVDGIQNPIQESPELILQAFEAADALR